MTQTATAPTLTKAGLLNALAQAANGSVVAKVALAPDGWPAAFVETAVKAMNEGRSAA